MAAAAAEAGLLVIADAKRGDVDVTSRAYAEAFLRAPIDALTINPSLGGDAVAPFIEAAAPAGRGLFALVRTSNPGAAELQDLPAGARRPVARGGGAARRRVGRPERRRLGPLGPGRGGRGDRARSAWRRCAR